MSTCSSIAHPYLADGGVKKYVGQVPCDQGCQDCYTLWVGCNLGAVPITCSPPDDNGQGNGTTAFQRVYAQNPGVTVHLVAPAVLGNYTFTAWRINDTLYVYDTAVDIELAGECMSAFAIYGPIESVTVLGGCGPIIVPEFITVSASWAVTRDDCVFPPAVCPQGIPYDAIWGQVRHSATCRRLPGLLSWGSGFPWMGDPDPQRQTPQCQNIGCNELPCPPQDAIDFQDCVPCWCGGFSCDPPLPECSGCCIGGGPDPCNNPQFSPHGSQWWHPCGAEFFAELECACVQLPDDPNWWIRARAYSGFGAGARAWDMCSGGGVQPLCCQSTTGIADIVGHDLTVDHYRGRFPDPGGCLGSGHLLLGGYNNQRVFDPCYVGQSCFACAVGTQFVI